jgi:hypothetical protein
MAKPDKRVLCGLLLGATGALVISGCSAWGGSQESFTDGAPVPVPITGLRFDVPVGSVHLRVEAGAPVSFRRQLDFHGARPGATTHVEGATLVLDGCGDDCGVGYDVVVPGDVTVAGDVGTGRIEVDRAASADVRSSAGEVVLHQISGDAAVTAGAGAVDVGLSKPGSVRVEAKVGTVTVSVPKASYAVSAHADVGQTDIAGVTQDASSPHQLNLRTGAGAVKVTTV